MGKAVILMGVSGCGKTTIGEKLSQRIGWPFYDGDDFHPPENVAKMASGRPLNDQDRLPWLRSLHGLIKDHLEAERSLILACSALKEDYRKILIGGLGPAVKFVYLKGGFDLIYQRLVERGNHYMKPEMLRSQYEILEEPERALVLDISLPVERIINQIVHSMNLPGV